MLEGFVLVFELKKLKAVEMSWSSLMLVSAELQRIWVVQCTSRILVLETFVWNETILLCTTFRHSFKIKEE